MSSELELGLDIFGDVSVDAGGRLRSHAQVLRDVVADDVGLDFFAVGEHHRADFTGLSRWDLKYSAGTLPHEQMLASIELHGRQVAPLVREQRGTLSAGHEQRSSA
jgi:hypothetical protein